MKVIIMCGGKGTRLREETSVKPKPMVEIGGRPVLWHIMSIYARFGFKDFVLPLGYKGQDKILEAKARIDGHNVPEHGPSADLDHGLGFDRGFFAQTRTLAAAHDDDFHSKPPAAAFHGLFRSRRVAHV